MPSRTNPFNIAPPSLVDVSAGADERITVLQAHEYPIVTEGIRLILEAQTDLQVIAQVHDGVEAVDACVKFRPKVALLSDMLPSLSGFEAARQIKQKVPTCNVVFLAKASTGDMVARALRAGATGYVLKTSSAAELVDAIRNAARSVTHFSPTIANQIVNDYVRLLQTEDESDPYLLLTEGERHVLQMVAEGYTGPQIASRLYITSKSVEKTRQRIMKKLDVRDVAGLVRAAIRMGIVQE
ncbi:MAG: DNA-binding response regulator [Proteobacteria bacterium]|nr:DNA-binding response regulator [Pseudomonadota bacterium]